MGKPPPIFTGAQVNQVLKLVAAMSNDGDLQVSVLATAFVVGCRACGVEDEKAIQAVTELFGRHFELVKLVRDDIRRRSMI